MSVTMGCFGDMSPREYPLRISLMRISSGQQMPLTAFRGRIWGTALQKNSLKHSLTLFAQPERLRKPQFWLNLTLQPKLWLRWNPFFLPLGVQLELAIYTFLFSLTYPYTNTLTLTITIIVTDFHLTAIDFKCGQVFLPVLCPLVAGSGCRILYAKWVLKLSAASDIIQTTQG